MGRAIGEAGWAGRKAGPPLKPPGPRFMPPCLRAGRPSHSRGLPARQSPRSRVWPSARERTTYTGAGREWIGPARRVSGEGEGAGVSGARAGGWYRPAGPSGPRLRPGAGRLNPRSLPARLTRRSRASAGTSPRYTPDGGERIGRRAAISRIPWLFTRPSRRQGGKAAGRHPWISARADGYSNHSLPGGWRRVVGRDAAGHTVDGERGGRGRPGLSTTRPSQIGGL